MTTRVNVVQDKENPVEKNILARAIQDISTALKRLQQSGVTQEAIIVLVKDRTGLTKGDIKAVFVALSQLEQDFVR